MPSCSDTDYNTDGKYHHNPLPVMFIVVTLIVVAAGILTYFAATEFIDHRNTLRGSVIAKIYSKDNNDINFTLQRREYYALEYFDQVSPPVLKNTFIPEYSAIVEPNQEMEIYLYTESPNAPNYEFIICKDANEADATEQCQIGFTFVLNENDKITKSIKFDCKQHETFSITVYALDNDKHVVSKKQSKAICMHVQSTNPRPLPQQQLQWKLKKQQIIAQHN